MTGRDFKSLPSFPGFGHSVGDSRAFSVCSDAAAIVGGLRALLSVCSDVAAILGGLRAAACRHDAATKFLIIVALAPVTITIGVEVIIANVRHFL